MKAWIILGVVAAHLLFFWLVSDKRFLPKTRYLPPPTPRVNFGAATTSSIDPQTGETTTDRQFMVSTQLATPPPRRTSPTP